MTADNELTGRIIACAIEVHKALGPGLREKSYEEAMAIEMEEQKISFERQANVGVQYKGRWVGEYRIDFVVDGAVIIEIKSVDRFEPLFEAQMIGYLRASRLRLGLLLNFNTSRVADGVRRFIC